MVYLTVTRVTCLTHVPIIIIPLLLIYLICSLSMLFNFGFHNLLTSFVFFFLN